LPIEPEVDAHLPLTTVAFEILLAALTGVAVSVGTMTFGPVLLFGFLVLPPIAARRLARSMGSYLVLASLAGVLAGVGGVVLSKYLDLPLGPAVVAVAALEMLPGAWVRKP